MNFYFLEFCDKKRGIMWAVGFRDHATDNQFFDESWKWKFLSRVLLFATLWTVQSMGFSKPGYWSGQPFPSSGDHPNPGIKLRSPTLQVDSLPAEPQGKPKHTGVGSLSILQQILLTQELNRDLLHCRQILYQLSFQGTPVNREEPSELSFVKIPLSVHCLSPAQ